MGNANDNEQRTQPTEKGHGQPPLGSNGKPLIWCDVTGGWCGGHNCFCELVLFA